MPDQERLLDELRLQMCDTSEERAWMEGFITGKNHARKQVVYVAVFCAVLTVLLCI